MNLIQANHRKRLGLILKTLLTLIFILILIPLIHAQDPPSPIQTTSVQKLIESIAELKQEILSLKTANQELRVQLNKKLDKEYNDLLIFISLFTVGTIALSKLLGRFYGWIMFKRLKRKTDKYQEEILTKFEVTHDEICQVYTKLSDVELKIKQIEENLVKLDVNIQKTKLKPPEPLKKKSFLTKLMFWKKKNG